MTQSLPRGRALAAARYEHGAGIWMRYHRRLHQRLVIDELVKLCRLRLVVQHQAPAEALGVVDEHMLVWRVALEQHLADLLKLHQAFGDEFVVPVAFGWSSHGNLAWI